ncbi:autophagy-related protein 27 [Aspergillus californicus]
MRISSPPFLSAAFLLPNLAAAITFDCAKILIGDYKYDLSPLSGVHTISNNETVQGSAVKTDYVLDVCEPLGEAATRDGIFCGASMNVCGFVYFLDTAGGRKPIPIAGNDNMGHGNIDPVVTRLKEIDPETEGLRVKLGGGKNEVDGKTKAASAVIEFVCDPDRSGLEGLGEDEDMKRLLRVRNEGDGDEGDGEERGPLSNGTNTDRSLQFRGFNHTEDDSYVLNLSWRTRYACDSYSERRGSSGHWGFFTWLIIIFFLCASAYLIFGAWLNYNRYGARGWDLLPHGDTIRDVPYLFQDWLRRVVNTFQGSGSRGGYSAV